MPYPTEFVFLCLTYFTEHNTLQVYPCCCEWKFFIVFDGLIVFTFTFCIPLYMCLFCFFGISHKIFSIDEFSVQSLSRVQLFADPMNCSMPGLPVRHQLPKFTQSHLHWVSDGIQPSHPLSSPSPPALNLSQHQGLFKWVSSSHHVAKVLEFQLQHQSFQWTLRTNFL